MIIIFKLFRANVKRELYLRGWKYKDLAERTGYQVGTIKSFMCGDRDSIRVALAISKCLGVEFTTD